jgi:hypothetical protein
VRFSGKEAAGLALAQENTTGYPCTVFAARLTDSEAIVDDFMRINLIIVRQEKVVFFQTINNAIQKVKSNYEPCKVF